MSNVALTYHFRLKKKGRGTCPRPGWDHSVARAKGSSIHLPFYRMA